MTFIRFWNYNGHGYGLNVTRSNWTDAKNYALSKGGYLVEINSPSENSFIDEITVDGLTGLADDDSFDYADRSLRYSQQESVSIDGGGSSYIWTGGTDAETEGQWMWANSRSPISTNTSLWGSGAGITEPDNAGSGQNYLGFALNQWPDEAPNGENIGDSAEWNDIKGDSLLYSIVEFDYLVDESRGFKLGEEPKIDIDKIGTNNNDENTKHIGRLYTAAFGRVPDEGGLQYWINVVNDPLVSYKDVSQNFVNSPEFSAIASPNSSSDLFATALYQNVLGRAPDSSGLGYWTNLLDTGLKDRADVLIGFADSPENVALYETLV